MTCDIECEVSKRLAPKFEEIVEPGDEICMGFVTLLPHPSFTDTCNENGEQIQWRRGQFDISVKTDRCADGDCHIGDLYAAVRSIVFEKVNDLYLCETAISVRWLGTSYSFGQENNKKRQATFEADFKIINPLT